MLKGRGKPSPRPEVPEAPKEPPPRPPTNGSVHNTHQQKSNSVKSSKPQFVFHCQQAHGSPTGLISGFSSIKELYQKIAECYDFSADEVRAFFPHIQTYYLLNQPSFSLMDNNGIRKKILTNFRKFRSKHGFP